MSEQPIYRVSFETVSAVSHPEYYRDERPIVAASEVPDEHWHTVERAGDGVHSQYNGLRQLIAQGELIRNVRLFTGEPAETRWSEVPARHNPTSGVVIVDPPPRYPGRSA